MRKLAFLLAVAGVSAAALAAGSRATLPVGNVLQNPGGDADMTVPVSPPSGWIAGTDALTTLNYGAGGFPSATDPGCPNCGNNFFYGGSASPSGILGFEVYRGRATARVRLSRTLLPAVFGGSAGGHAYAFRDIHGRPGSRYWIRVVRLGGSASWVGPARAG